MAWKFGSRYQDCGGVRCKKARLVLAPSQHTADHVKSGSGSFAGKIARFAVGA